MKEYEEDNSNCQDTVKVKRKRKIGISDRELLKVIKEQQHFPVSFSQKIKLADLVYYYNKFWYNDFTDQSAESDTDEEAITSVKKEN